jgi:hypothetical protein
VASVVDLPYGSAVNWGAAVVSDGGYAYIYGSEASSGSMRPATGKSCPIR